MARTSFSLIFLSLICLLPLTASAEKLSSTDCEVAQGKMKQAYNNRVPIELQREHTQERVRHIYENLFICHSTDLLSKKHQLHCQQLEQEAPKQFQTMIKLVTASHEASRQIHTLTQQVQKVCPASSAKASFTHISRLSSH